MNEIRRAISVLLALASIGIYSPLAQADALPTTPPAAAPASTEQGIWQEHKYRFQFMGFTATYSCDGLADKLALLLKYAGARGDVKAVAGACASGFGRPDKFASADLTFHTLATAGDAGEKPTAAVWRSIDIATRRPHDLGDGDCELVEQFRDKLLPLFTTRHVESNTTCVPHQLSGSSISLKFDALTAVPVPPKAG